MDHFHFSAELGLKWNILNIEKGALAAMVGQINQDRDVDNSLAVAS